MGAVLGHEFTHGFDDVGRRYDMKGKLHNWWTKADVSNFKQRAQCLVDLYTTYTVDGHHLDGQQTLAENIADAGGVKLSHKVGFELDDLPVRIHKCLQHRGFPGHVSLSGTKMHPFTGPDAGFSQAWKNTLP